MEPSDAYGQTCGTPADPPPVTVIAGRYRLTRVLGRGGCGEVHAALDLVTGAAVAVKRMLPGRTVDPARVRREVRALRVLRLPGVVNLVDEGMDGDSSFLVMDLVEGQPFPGVGVPAPSDGLLVRAQSLLTTLARVHELGVVHRDLKPGNVLVDDAGRVTLLDFGLAAGTVVGDRITEDGFILGTPAYLAPEQVTGGAVGVRADLYTTGVMLFEALTGRLPFDSPDTRTLLLARVTRPAPAVRSLRSDVPEALADLVDALLARRPEDRPRSAADALAILGGAIQAPANTLPFLGRATLLDAAVRTLAAGKSLSVAARSGHGRTRFGREVAARLENLGREVVRLFPARRPFGSLGRLADVLAEQRGASLEIAVALAEGAVVDALGAGIVLLADDADRLDRYTQALLDRLAERGGGVLRLFPEDAAPLDAALLGPLGADELVGLFAGPEVILHLPEDAARLLSRRTAGVPARVASEVDAWVASGVARWVGQRLRVDRSTLDRLLAAPIHLSAGTLQGAATEDEPELREHLGWLALAGPRVPLRVVQSAMGMPTWAFEAGVRELEARGWARSLEADVSGLRERLVELRIHVALDEVWPAKDRQAAHRALADGLSVGTAARLYHRFAGGATAGLAAEVEAHARQEVAFGRVNQALAALAEGAAMLRGSAELGQRASLLALWTEFALLDGSTAALDAGLYEVCRCTPGLPALEALLRAALAAAALAGPEALPIARAVPPFEALALERARRGVWLLAARGCPLADEERVLAECLSWADGRTDRQTRATAAFWEARVAYRRAEFARAAERFEVAAAAFELPTEQIHAALRAASCWMETFDFDRAASIAAVALPRAVELRHCTLEARAWWLVRTIDYRAGALPAECPGLLDAANELGSPALLPLMLLTEAAIAWRAGRVEEARRLAVDAGGRFAAVRNVHAGDLAIALALACGEPATPARIDTLVEHAPQCPYALTSVQTVGLIALACPARGAALHPLAERLAAACPPAAGPNRLDVISADEAVAMCLGRFAG